MFTFRTAVVVAAICLAITFYFKQGKEEPPLEFDHRKWWGDGERPEKEDHSIRPFKIQFNETRIADLKQRVKNRRPLTKPLEGIQSEYGINTDYLTKILKYWVEEYDFKKRVDMFNRFYHYKTQIQGLDIHFIRARPLYDEGMEVLPILIMHGWPSSSKEFDKIIPILTSVKKGYNFVFEVIAADLPGFGFSQGTNKPGFNPVQIGIIMRNLMLRLGIEKFYVHAGDWGSQCGIHMATLFPDTILGFHTNMAISSRPISIIKIFIGSLFPSFMDYEHGDRVYPLSKYLAYLYRESGYYHIQATKPDTVGVALIDSPSGLAAYIMEKMAICSNKDQLNTPHGGLENLNIDDVLDTVTITWMNDCIVTSMRIYAEGLAWPEVHIVHNIPTEVPTAAIKFLHEVMYMPDCILRDKFLNLIRSTVLNFGGHFAALQTPEVLADDIFASVAEFIKFYNDTAN